MILNKCSVSIIRPEYETNLYHLGLQFVFSILLLAAMIIGGIANAGSDKSYLRIERSLPGGDNDLTITSMGGLRFEGNVASHVDLSYLDSDANGQGMTLDFGGGYVFKGRVSLLLGLGVSLGYNWDKDDYIAAYYPEIGVVVDITKKFGLTVSGKRYFNLYDETENSINLGLLFMY